jgi:uncharacterized protein (TIGR00730 family)
MKRVTVFCGSNLGTDEVFKMQAYLVGQTLAEQNIGVVYGGARMGLMGAVADGALSKGGEVIGVLPHFLQEKEIAHEGLTNLILVESMHERKTKMNDLSDGVLTLPGGFGTLEEFLEMITWAQLGLHKKPVAVLNVDGFYDPLISLLEKMVDKGFLKKQNRDMLLMSDNIEDLITQMKNYVAPVLGKWITKEKL